MPLTPGAHVGPYEVIALLGAGGMGEVYRARDTKLGRDVALKVLPALVAHDADRLARFRREAQMLASLNDPHIAQIYGLEDSGDTHALVMELVDGPTLADRIAPGPIPITDALAIARQLAEALEAAHDKGIVHRDLKPANVKVREDGTVKVLDFGLAKAFESPGTTDAGLANSPTVTAPTAMGTILGTAAYMAPEQARGRAVDKRADIWAFGVVLFEMLTGGQLFTGETVSDTLAAVLRQEIDWTQLPPDTPPRVRQLLQRCLERDPKRRLRDIGDAAFELDARDAPLDARSASSTSQTASAAPAAAPASTSATASAPALTRVRLPRRRLLWILAAVIVAWIYFHSTASSPAPLAPRNVVRVGETINQSVFLPDLSRDGTEVAYTVGSGPRAPFLVVRKMDELDGKPVAGAEGGGAAIFSPDGQWLAYTALDQPQREIRKIPVSGGTSVLICNGDFFNGGAWGDDDTIVFTGPDKRLMRVPASGGTPQALTTLDANKSELAHTQPQFLAGGHELLFTVDTSDKAEFAVLTLPPAAKNTTAAYRTIADGGVHGRYVASGHLTYMRENTLFAEPFDLKRMAVTGAAVPVIEHISTAPFPGASGDYAVSDTGLLTYLVGTETSQGTTLAWVDRKGVTRVLAGASRQFWGTGRLSPDGKRIVDSIRDDKGGFDIWVFDIGRGTLTRLTFSGQNDAPIWTPDGRRIIYTASLKAQGGRSGLYTVAADGSGQPTSLLVADPLPVPTSVAADGSVLLFNREAGTVEGAAAVVGNGQSRIFELPLSATAGAAEPRPLHETSVSERNAEISPDGHWVAYESLESGDWEVYVQPFPGPGPRVRISTQGGRSPRWAHDGRELYYWSGGTALTRSLVEVDIPPGAALDPGMPRVLFQLNAGTTWDVSPEYNRFLVELVGSGNPASQTSTMVTVTNWFDELRRLAPAKP